MSDHPSSRFVTFRQSFSLPGMSAPHTPGTFEVLVEEEHLDVMWNATRSRLSIVLPYPGRVEAIPVTNHDLEDALERDIQSKPRSGFS